MRKPLGTDTSVTQAAMRELARAGVFDDDKRLAAAKAVQLTRAGIQPHHSEELLGEFCFHSS